MSSPNNLNKTRYVLNIKLPSISKIIGQTYSLPSYAINGVFEQSGDLSLTKLSNSFVLRFTDCGFNKVDMHGYLTLILNGGNAWDDTVQYICTPSAWKEFRLLLQDLLSIN